MKKTFSLFLLVLIAFNSLFSSNDLKLYAFDSKSLSFQCEFDNPDNCFLQYGLTPALELGQTKGLTLDNLQPATIYYVRAFSESNEIREYSETGIFSTASKSPGEIRVYFNHWCDNSTAISDAIWTENFEDTIIAYINSAQISLDICNYNTGSLPIVTAINNAYSRGVTVRYIAASNTGTNNDEIDQLSTSIPFIQRPDDGEVMHNKFIIKDLSDSDNAAVLTGSTNHTYNSCHDDYNNLVIVFDQALANAYKTEFEEMWGSTTNTPNPSNAKFGADKTDNTPHSFNIGGIPVELYFSPSDATTSHIESTIRTANTNLEFAMLTFIHNDLGDACVDLQSSGVEVKGIIENILYWGSEYNNLLDGEVDVLSHMTEANFFHHKYAVVDATNPASNPLVITGSHNWTNSAEEDYDENTLIIYDAEIAAMYYEEFMARYAELTGANTSDNFLKSLTIYPNPVKDFFEIQCTELPLMLRIYNSQGVCVCSYKNPKENIYKTESLSSGIYSLEVILDNKIVRSTIVICK
jgi:phosphatidylserine/phosphatidylglycerophosphate/cardiolipin synthase-like enzyme